MTHTKLQTIWSKAIVFGFRIAVHRLDHHRDGRTISWIIPEDFNGVSFVVQNDVIVIRNRCRSQCDVASCAIAKHGDFIRINAERVVHFRCVHAKESGCRAGILNATVRGVDQLKRPLYL